ncbi:hypothetical protein PAUR_a4568 [Pseudoalteromonas aurantia 208]|uniref:Uncharacterized protein n=1 Tax=Pseudoalteromonas aurantia 208 TaxID=1314867 RepID=A0ABR9EG35_9GAMM|nr:hypothetical protein [Pseudoalteromonas aurantia 208]
MKVTPRVRKIALLGKFAYPELRLFSMSKVSGELGGLQCCVTCYLSN